MAIPNAIRSQSFSLRVSGHALKIIAIRDLFLSPLTLFYSSLFIFEFWLMASRQQL
jgi:hypothetical protein